ncbi:hypothetical protein [Veronia pacifica]|uniref:Uncharacterized protein n=1 Tax=Veronia pacifica TaxID=1080227 RepID=A0A1C3ERK8_9GAMM|nr:hypothetical protein [Veronia pacifica]ODA35877.1 hypothetical protein A8L45_02255 [Veronia pacifica]
MMKEWEMLCTAGNECFNQCQWHKAKHFYLSALVIMDELFSSSPSDDAVMLAWLVTHHNLASLYGATGDKDEQIKHLTTPFIVLRDQLRVTAPSDGHYPTILHALNKCKLELSLNTDSSSIKSQQSTLENVNPAKPGDTIH